MRRTNTDYKFTVENPNVHYLSTHSLKSNCSNDSQIQPNLEFDYYFDHSCQIEDHTDICHRAMLNNTYESGIGSSISSIDTHFNFGSTAEESSVNCSDSDQLMSLGSLTNNIYSHFDYHDLPPVTEEEDYDSILGILNSSENENKHLDYLPWQKCINYIPCINKQSNTLDNVTDGATKKDVLNYNHWWDHYNCNCDDFNNYCSNFPQQDSCDTHIEIPWISSTYNLKPVLSSGCHKSEDCILKSETFLSHRTNINVMSDKAVMYKVFQRRHSIQDGSSTFTYNIRSVMTMDQNENNLDDEEDIQALLSD